MIVNENLTDYISSLEYNPPDFLEDIRKEAVSDDVPVIRRETESLLKVLLGLVNPDEILEIGSGVAYSAIMMASCSNANITTIENYDKRIIKAKENISKNNLNDRIKLVEADAVKFLKDNDKQYDFIFLDAAKGQYIEMLDYIADALEKGKVLVADNVLQDGGICQSRFMIERRQRTIHERMREFLWEIKHRDEFETCILTVGDGVSISIRR